MADGLCERFPIVSYPPGTGRFSFFNEYNSSEPYEYCDMAISNTMASF